MSDTKSKPARLATSNNPNWNWQNHTPSGYRLTTPNRLNERDCRDIGLPVKMIFNTAMRDHYND